MSEFDLVGVGLNATDTLLILPHFPAYAGPGPSSLARPPRLNQFLVIPRERRTI